MYTAQNIEKALKKLGSKEKAKSSAWFFKTKKGEYGYGDVFYGVTVPEQRRVARLFCDVPLAELQKLLNNKVHECRLTALLILGDRYKKGSEKEKQNIVRFYLKNTKRINNWDLVDLSASYILGNYLLSKKEPNNFLSAKLVRFAPSNSPRLQNFSAPSLLYSLARSNNMWERRIAIVATYAFIKKGEFKHTLTISKILLNDTEDLLHKACGWMLREVGKKDVGVLEKFLLQHKNMPRTMLRYAIEKFPEQKRKKFLEYGKLSK